jgi:hypothetical protein
MTGQWNDGFSGSFKMDAKRILGSVLILVGLLANRTQGQDAEAESPGWIGGSADLAVFSGYLWHGMLINDEPVLQPALTLEVKDFAFGIWGNCDLTDAATDDAPAFTEVDFSASYSFNLTQFDFSLGYSQYTYPNTFIEEEQDDGTVARQDPEDTRLVYATAGLSEGVVVPSLTVEYGFSHEETLYASLGLVYERELAETLAVEVSGSLAWGSGGYHSVNFDVDEAALSDATLGVSLIWSPTDQFSLTGSVTGSYLVSDTIADAAEAGGYDSPEAWVGGLAASYSF